MPEKQPRVAVHSLSADEHYASSVILPLLQDEDLLIDLTRLIHSLHLACLLPQRALSFFSGFWFGCVRATLLRVRQETMRLPVQPSPPRCSAYADLSYLNYMLLPLLLIVCLFVCFLRAHCVYRQPSTLFSSFSFFFGEVLSVVVFFCFQVAREIYLRAGSPSTAHLYDSLFYFSLLLFGLRRLRLLQSVMRI